jgi:hypothetical protein
MIFAFGSAPECPTHQLGDCLVCGAEMIRQGPSWRFRNKDTYYSQERRSDMMLNLTELRDEPLGKHPIQAMTCGYNLCTVDSQPDVETGQVMTAPDDMRSFTFDVDGLGDEALDSSPCDAVVCYCVWPTCR